MCGDHLGGCEGGEGGDVPEGDPDLLGESLGEESVPGDGGGHEGEGGHQRGQIRQLLVSSSQARTGQGPGGEDVVSGGGETHSLYQSSEGLLGSKEKSDDTCLHHWLGDQHCGALSDNLASVKQVRTAGRIEVIITEVKVYLRSEATTNTQRCQWISQQLEVEQLLRSDSWHLGRGLTGLQTGS